jgi:histone deacetylase 8
MLPTFSQTRRLQIVTPRKATYKDLAVYHTRDYLETVLQLSRDSSNSELDNEFGLEDACHLPFFLLLFLTGDVLQDCPLFPGLSEYIQLVGGATLTAATALQNIAVDIAICWDGGRHHARKDQASGFCYVADCILAILALKRSVIWESPTTSISTPSPQTTEGEEASSRKRRARVMYLDLDLHFSDAVSEAFYSLTSSNNNPQILVSE